MRWQVSRLTIEKTSDGLRFFDTTNGGRAELDKDQAIELLVSLDLESEDLVDVMYLIGE